MIDHEPRNFHMEYMDVTQHWCADSAKYAGGDCLVTALFNGWEMNPVIQKETKWYAGNRFVYIYHFSLSRAGEQMVMPVVTNPYIEKLIAQPAIELHIV